VQLINCANCFVLHAVDEVLGVAVINNVLYVVSYQSSVISTYAADTLSPIGEDIRVDGMTRPCDIVACQQGRQLYVLGLSKCVWRVSTERRRQYEQWLNVESSHGVMGMSLTSGRLLVASDPRSLLQYSATDRRLLRVVQLSDAVKYLTHATETTRQTFVICHQGTALEAYQWAVSKLRFRALTGLLIGVNPAGDAGVVSPPIFWLMGTSMGMSPPIFGVAM